MPQTLASPSRATGAAPQSVQTATLPWPVPGTRAPLPASTHPDSLPPLRVGLMGLGNVGAGTLAVLRRNQAEMARRLGRRIEVTHVCVRNLARAAALAGPGVQVLADPLALVTHPDVDVVVEAIGGTGPVLHWVLQAIASGKHVVTANKALLAEHGHQVFAAAQARGTVVAFEGAVAVSIPIIKMLREGLGANHITAVAGIVNGTSNFILSAMRTGLSFQAALQQAQALGYAEADPSFDVNGVDAAHKLTLLASVAFGMPLRLAQVHTEGIGQLQPADVACAEALGYRIKLLAQARRHPHGVELHVYPALVPATHPLAVVEGSLNGIAVHSDASGPTLHCGAGAGGEQTASAVIADLMDIARLGPTSATSPTPRVAMLGFQPWAVQDLPVLPMTEVHTRHWVRVPVGSDPLALAAVAAALAQAGVTVQSLGWSAPAPDAAGAQAREQAAAQGGPERCVVGLTGLASDRAMQQALAGIRALRQVSDHVAHLRVAELD